MLRFYWVPLISGKRELSKENFREGWDKRGFTNKPRGGLFTSLWQPEWGPSLEEEWESLPAAEKLHRGLQRRRLFRGGLQGTAKGKRLHKAIVAHRRMDVLHRASPGFRFLPALKCGASAKGGL